MPMLTVAAHFTLPDDALASAKLQVAVLELADAFKKSIEKLKVEHEFSAGIASGVGAAPAVKVRKTRTPRVSAASTATRETVDEPIVSQPAVDPAPAKPSPPWAKPASAA